MLSSLQLVTALAAVIFAGCGGPRFAAEQVVAPGYRATADERIALFPLVVRKAETAQRDAQVGGNLVTFWTWTTPMSVAEYRPAASRVDDELARALESARPVRAAAVEASLTALQPTTLPDAVRGVATQTKTDAVLIIEVDDFKATTPSGMMLDGATSSALVNASLYDATGEIRWTLSSRITLECPLARRTPPSLAELMKIAMTGFTPMIRGLQDPRGAQKNAAPKRLDGWCALRP